MKGPIMERLPLVIIFIITLFITTGCAFIEKGFMVSIMGYKIECDKPAEGATHQKCRYIDDEGKVQGEFERPLEEK